MDPAIAATNMSAHSCKCLALFSSVHPAEVDEGEVRLGPHKEDTQQQNLLGL